MTKEQMLLPLIALVAWSVYSVMFTRVASNSSPVVILAMYTTVFALFSWIAVLVGFMSGEKIHFSLETKNVVLILAMGLLAFIANYSFLKGLNAGVEPTTMYLTVALVACGSLLVHSVLLRQLPTLPQTVSIVLGSIAAFMAMRYK